MKSFSYSELDKLTGEVLPERAVLSTLLVGGGGGSENGNLNFNHNDGNGGSGGNTTVHTPVCQSNITHSQGGLIGALGLSSENPNSSFTCAGTAVSSSTH